MLEKNKEETCDATFFLETDDIDQLELGKYNQTDFSVQKLSQDNLAILSDGWTKLRKKISTFEFNGFKRLPFFPLSMS